MNTTDYIWYHPEFSEYNVAQKAVIPYCSEDYNIIVCFGTAVGKTVIGECCFGYHVNHGGRVAYVSPYRSLCQEKFEKWTKDVHFSNGGVCIHTGDHRSSKDDMKESDLTVITCEAFDVRTRKERWAEWMQTLQCVVFDEAHMIGDKTRGAALEASLMRFTKHFPKCRIVMLSATMDNAVELAKWVKSLNGKPTKCFTSNWRPNKVNIVEIPENGWESMIDRAISLAKESTGKTIVFVHSKQVGKSILKKLKKDKVKTAFHNGSLSKGQRDKIEQAFSDQFSGLDILVSTSTLGAGVNVG